MGPAQIHLATIKLVGGNAAKFREGLELAERDWRDVFGAAGLPNANWRRELAHAGMRVP